MASNIQQARQSQFANTPQNLLKSYSKRLQDDVGAMIDNLSEIIKSAKVEETLHVDKVTQSFFDTYQMQVRAANIVRAGESLLKLVNELKTFVILYDFPSINQHVKEDNDRLLAKSAVLQKDFVKLREEFANALDDLEAENYGSLGKLEASPE